MALLGVLGRHNLGDLFPVLVIKLLYELGILDHEREKTILEQMCLVILPLCECPLTLCWVLFLIKKLVKDLHGLLVGYDAFAIELILSVPEPYDVVNASLAASSRIALAADRVLLIKLLDQVVLLVGGLHQLGLKLLLLELQVFVWLSLF